MNYEGKVFLQLVRCEIILEAGKKPTPKDSIKYFRIRYFILIHVLKCKLSKRYLNTAFQIVKLFIEGGISYDQMKVVK